MIPFDFEYYRPHSIQEAVEKFHALRAEGRQPIYFSGGTEIITFGRIGHLVTDAVLDIKSIPECNALGWSGDQLVLGAALTLNRVTESGVFPLLGEVLRHTADHTTRNKITLGGNLCAAIPYREAVLPFLLGDSYAVVAGWQGNRVVPMHDLQVEPGELLVQVWTERQATRWQSVTIKKTKQEEVDYPLVRLALVHDGQGVRAAFSGVCEAPFRSWEMEAVLNQSGVSLEARISEAIRHLPGPVVNDYLGSADYRVFVLHNTLREALMKLEGGQYR
ncbi:FAD binding domain-containing protein [Tumebacillus sp. ITR2]|uniref:FAD binding domain-containing protein n=1 Tax=Tumebacillus amylolyticus TaxID=2801339 RepID=A0ABS1JB58_9BACL|nr:FAD binding domain-containing protein [Tumebacillus amylolyticus]MBL0387425.1 FAD binding domain-containing protein [Tumebacillus amylolyticus]